MRLTSRRLAKPTSCGCSAASTRSSSACSRSSAGRPYASSGSCARGEEAATAMRLVVTVLARDEADIIDDQVAFHLNAGADFVIATDNNSRDGTTEILERYERDGVLHLIREPAEGLRQGEWVTRMARLAAEEYGADWVINTDADEFWWPRGGSLKEVLGAVPQEYGIVQGFWRSFVPRPDDGQPFAERMTARLSQHAPINDPTSFYRPVVKVAHRADPQVTVARGNHALAGQLVPDADDVAPDRGAALPAALARAVDAQGRAAGRRVHEAHRALGDRLPPQGLRRAAERAHRASSTQSLVVDDAALERGVADGTLVLDTRLRDALRAIRAGEPLDVPAPTLADDAAYAVEAAALSEAYAVRAQRRLDGIEQRLLSLERAVTQIVGSVLVRNEDVFVERVDPQRRRVLRPHPRRRPRLDRPHLGDRCARSRESSTISTCADRATRRARTACSRRTRAPTTWVLGVDGDELYDPAGLARLRVDLLAGAHADVFRLKAHVLNCDELDVDRGRASGWLAPPSRPVTKLFNFAVRRVVDGEPRPAAGRATRSSSRASTGSRGATSPIDTTWETDPLRLLHVCFLPRVRAWTRRRRARESRRVARVRPRPGRDAEASRPPAADAGATGPNWKREWYARGERVTVDASPFLGRLGFARCTGPGRSSPRASTASPPASSAGASSRPTSCTTVCSRTARADGASRTSPPQLDEIQQGILERLREEGYATLPFSELVPDPGVWQELEADGARFVGRDGSRACARARGRRLGAAPTRRQGVPRPQVLVGRRARPRRSVASARDEPAPARPRERLSRACGRSSSTSTSGTRAPAGGDERRSSQRWHRDFNDRHLLKAFLYLVDVDEDTGPVRVRAAQRARRRARTACGRGAPSARTTRPRTSSRSSVNGRSVTFTAPKGTIIFCNTSGFHRGGFARLKPRVLATLTWDSPASLKALSERNYVFGAEQRRRAHRTAALRADLTRRRSIISCGRASSERGANAARPIWLCELPPESSSARSHAARTWKSSCSALACLPRAVAERTQACVRELEADAICAKSGSVAARRCRRRGGVQLAAYASRNARRRSRPTGSCQPGVDDLRGQVHEPDLLDDAGPRRFSKKARRSAGRTCRRGRR